MAMTTMSTMALCSRCSACSVSPHSAATVVNGSRSSSSHAISQLRFTSSTGIRRHESALPCGFSWRHGRRKSSIRRNAGFSPGQAFALSSNDFKTGTTIELDGAPWKVLEFLHVKPGKGAAFVRTKLRNYVTGNTVDRTFRAGEQVTEANVEKDVKQFSYMDAEQYVFMDMETYEESRLSAKDVGDRSKFLKEGMDCSVITWNDKVIDMDLPVTVKLKVTEADPGVKGDTAQGGTKLITVETGAQVTVPLFVQVDDTIVIQTKDGTYISRA